MKAEDTIRLEGTHIMQTYRRQPLVLTQGKGTRVWDADGREYLDFVSGLAVCGLGHCHPAVAQAIADQAATLIHCSNLYYTVPQARLAARLAGLTGLERVFFANSGAEANEGAIKLARKYGRTHGGDRHEIVCTHNSFHGRTLATLAATGQPRYRQGFEPLPPGFVHVPFNDPAALRTAVGSQTVAIMVEPVQGEGGIHPATAAFMQTLDDLRKQHGVLLIFDEIQCGLGRTGRWFAFEHYRVRPDIMTLAKSIASGLPLGAVCAREEVASALTRGDHASTFGGNPVACRAALAVLDAMEAEGQPALAAATAAHFRRRLDELAAQHRCITDVRGLGLMLAIELDRDAMPVVDACRERGLLVNCTAGTVLRFLPPVNVSPAEVDRALDIVAAVLSAQV
jgi:predicted acetylornithine/succinylornithine family transaminase